MYFAPTSDGFSSLSCIIWNNFQLLIILLQ